MATSFGSFEEFWAALNCLYENTLRRKESQKQGDERLNHLTERVDRMADHMDQLTDQMVQATERLDRLVSQVATVAGTVAQLATIVESHERRLSRLEGD